MERVGFLETELFTVRTAFPETSTRELNNKSIGKLVATLSCLWPLYVSKMAAGCHLGFLELECFTIRLAVPEIPLLELNITSLS